MSSLTQDRNEVLRFNNTERATNHILCEFDEIDPFLCDGRKGRPSDICLTFPIQYFVWDYADQRAAHERTALAGTYELLPRDRVHELKEAAVEIAITFFAQQI